MQNVTFNVQGMSCGHCVKAVETAVQKLKGIEEVSVNLENAQATVSFDEAQVSANSIKEAIEDQGYDVN